MDGVDAVLIETRAGRFRRVLAHHETRYDEALRASLLQLSTRNIAVPLADYARLDAAVGDSFATAALALLEKAGVARGAVRAIGSHGQTVFHLPGGVHANTLQIGDPARIAARTGIPTVADFRRGDMAAGGQGAPLAPAFHHAAFARAGEFRCVVNLGGIANVTLLDGDDATRVTGFDTGPANGLMDEWSQRCRNQPCDTDGTWARSGQVNESLLTALRADGYFSRPAPKSTGRDYFNLAWVIERHPALEALPSADVQRTLCELTAQTVTATVGGAQRLLLCGGGARNGFLVERLQANFDGIVEPVDAHGVDPQHVEGAAFAWLAMRRLRGEPGNLPGVTGARAAVVLGGIFAA